MGQKVLQPIDLNACKHIACLMVMIEPTPNPNMPELLAIHPYTAYRHVHLPESSQNLPDGTPNIGIVDILTDSDGLKKWQQTLIDRIKEFKKIDYILYLLNGPYMMNYLRLIRKHIHGKQELADLLKYCWTSQEFPNWNERGHALRTCLAMFKQVRDYIMDENEKQFFDSLPEEITIYRGQFHCKGPKPYPALSWTNDPDRAMWFVSHRYQPDGIFYRGTIKKKDVMCYLNNRGESELIVDYTKIYDIEEVDYE